MSGIRIIGLDLAKTVFQAHDADAQARKRPTAGSGEWMKPTLRFRAGGRIFTGTSIAMEKALDFMLSERRDAAAARRFFKRANGVPDRGGIDNSCANLAGLQGVNVILKVTGPGKTITVR